MIARKNFFRISLIVLIFTVSLAVAGLLLAQDTPPVSVPRAEITGVDPSALPTVVTSINVYDTLGQPVSGLTADDFSVTGALEGRATVISVENISSDNLPFSTVLVIDVSSSMFDYPIEQARAAARTFVDGIRPIDSVAIVTFGNTIDIVQSFTTDKTTLYNAIDSIVAYGQTALYQGTYNAVELADIAPNDRRAIIVLSDGAEFGGVSRVGRSAARELAVQTGVPVYTIGVGYGFDRTYLQSLSESTNARFYESPTAVELTDIFGNLARLLSSQYVVTLNVDIPADGTEYPLQLRVQTPQGEAITPPGILRAPIPIPLVDFAPLTDNTISVPTTFTADVRADQPITGVVFGVLDASGAGVMAQNDTEAPYEITLDPVSLLPGDYTLTALASDEDGDIGGGELAITIAALPSVIEFAPNPSTLGAISEPVTIQLNISGQTAPVNVAAALGATIETLSEPYTITIDPARLEPGNNALAVRVTNEGGVTSDASATVQIAALPPTLTVEGLTEGQLIETPTTFNVTNVDSQTPLTRLSVEINGTPLESANAGEYTIDPRNFAPGTTEIIIDIANRDSQNRIRVPVEIAALPPIIMVDGLSEGDTLTSNRALTFTFDSQTPVIHVAVFLDGVDLAHLVQAPYILGLEVLRIPPGDHTLRVVADNTGGGSATLDIPFSVSPAPAATATASAVQATATAAAVTATYNAQLTATAVQATAIAQATATAVQATAVQATVFSESTRMQATVNAQSTAIAAQATAAQATVLAQQTAAQATVFTERTQVQATAFAGATQAAVSATAAQSTLVAEQTAIQATNFVQATQSQATALVESTLAQATVFTERTQIQATAFAGATQAALEQAVSATAAQSTIVAQRTARQATIDGQVRGTSAAQTQTQIGEDARATATSVQSTIESQRATALQATTLAQATALQIETLQASATAVQATQDAEQTNIPLTRTESAANVRALATDAQATLIVQREVATDRAVSATTDAEATLQALQREATLTAQFTPTPSNTPTPTFTPSNTPTETPDIPATQTLEAQAAILQATDDAQLTRQAGVAATISAGTRAALATNAAEAQAIARSTQAARTSRAIATLTEAARPTETPTATPSLTMTPTETADIPATGTASAQTATSEAELTAVQATLDQERVVQATVHARETRDTRRESTIFARATNNAQATLDMAAAALGTITLEPTGSPTATDDATAEATPEGGISGEDDATPTIPPSLTPIGTLTQVDIEDQPPPASDFAPLAVVIVVVLLLLLLVFLLARRRISRN